MFPAQVQKRKRVRCFIHRLRKLCAKQSAQACALVVLCMQTELIQ